MEWEAWYYSVSNHHWYYIRSVLSATSISSTIAPMRVIFRYQQQRGYAGYGGAMPGLMGGGEIRYSISQSILIIAQLQECHCSRTWTTWWWVVRVRGRRRCSRVSIKIKPCVTNHFLSLSSALAHACSISGIHFRFHFSFWAVGNGSEIEKVAWCP